MSNFRYLILEVVNYSRPTAVRDLYGVEKLFVVVSELNRDEICTQLLGGAVLQLYS